jgi:hypothetical protein
MGESLTLSARHRDQLKADVVVISDSPIVPHLGARRHSLLHCCTEARVARFSRRRLIVVCGWSVNPGRLGGTTI